MNLNVENDQSGLLRLPNLRVKNHWVEDGKTVITADMHEKNRANRPRGLESSQAKLDDEKVRFIRASPLSTRKLAELLGVGPTTIRGVRNGRVWSHVK